MSSNSSSVKFDAAVTLRADDSSCYFESQGSNESPSARVDRHGHPMFSFERCVFRFVRTESSIVDRESRDVMVYGSTVRIINPATMLVVCVVRTETVYGGRGCRVVMRPMDQAPVGASTFRVISNMRNRSGADHVQNRDFIILQLDNSELYVTAIEISGGGAHQRPVVEIVASTEPKTWTVSMFDDGYLPSTGFAFASRVLAIEHRHHRSYLTHGSPVCPSDHRRAAARRSLWIADDALTDGHQPDIADILASNNALTSTVYFQAPSSTSSSSAVSNSSNPSGQAAMTSSHLHCSCTALWIAENLDPTMGGPLRVGHHYRIRHMASGRYLSVIEAVPDSFELNTIGEADHQFLRRSVFLLDSNAEDDQGHISSYHSFVRLQHVETGLWLASRPHNELSVARTEALRRPSAHDRISLRHPSDSIVSKMLLLMNYMKLLREHVVAFGELRDTPLTVSRIARDQGIRNVTERTHETLLALLQFCSMQPTSGSQSVSSHDDGSAAAMMFGGLPGGGGDAANNNNNSSGEAGGGEAGGGEGQDNNDMTAADAAIMFRTHTDFSSLIPDKERQQMLIELEIPQLVMAVLVSPFTNHEGGRIEDAFPLHGGLLSLQDLHDRQLSHLLQIHTTGLTLIERMAKGFIAGSNAASTYLDILLQFESSHPKTAAAAILTVLESCTSVDAVRGEGIANTLVELLRGTHLKPSAAAMYLSCLSNLRDARPIVCELVRQYEREILYTMTTGYGRMLIAPPRPGSIMPAATMMPPTPQPASPTAKTLKGNTPLLSSAFSSTTPSPSLPAAATKTAVASATAASSASTTHDVVPFELFVSHGDADKMDCFISSIELLMRIAPRERDSEGFQFVASRISRDHIIYVLKAGAREHHISSTRVSGGDHPIHTIHALFVEAAMTLFLIPNLLEHWDPQVLVICKQLSDPSSIGESRGRLSPTSASSPRMPSMSSSSGEQNNGRVSPNSSSLLPRSAATSTKLARAAQSIGDATFIRQMKATTMDVLKSDGGQILQQKGRNLLLSRCVEVWGLVLNHGFATPKEIEEVIPLLLALMDGRRDRYSAHMSGVVWNRYEHSDYTVPVVNTKIAVCSVLREYLKSQIRAAAASVAQSIASADDDEGNTAASTTTGGVVSAAVAETMAADVHKRAFHTRSLLNFPECCPVLLDLVRYQSDALAHSAVCLLTELSSLSEMMSSSLSSVIVLPSSQRMVSLYQKLVATVSEVQLKLISGERDTITSDVEALTSLLEGSTTTAAQHRRAHRTTTVSIREGPAERTDDDLDDSSTLADSKKAGTRLLFSPSQLTPPPKLEEIPPSSLMMLDDDEAESAAIAFAERSHYQLLLLRIMGSIPQVVSGIVELIPTLMTAAANNSNTSSSPTNTNTSFHLDPRSLINNRKSSAVAAQLLLEANIRFLYVFSSLEANAALISSQWPTIFELLLSSLSTSAKTSSADGGRFHQLLLRLLERLLPQGNQRSPLNRNDIRSLVRIYRDEKYPEVIRVLSSMFVNSVPKPLQQRDVITLLVDHDIFKDQWWASVHRGVLADFVDLMLYCGDGNSLVQVQLQNLLPAESILLFIQTLHGDEGPLRALLIRFVSCIHLVPAEMSDASGGGGSGQPQRGGGGQGAGGVRRLLNSASPASQVNISWTANELWWRLVRDDFSMRFDELATLSKKRKNWFSGAQQSGPSSKARSYGGMTSAVAGGGSGNKRRDGIHSWRQQAVEAAMCVGNFFRHRFVLQHAVKLDWVMKEVRSLVSAFTQLLFMVSQLDLDPAELDALIQMGSTLHDALVTFSESIVPRLMTSLEEAIHHRVNKDAPDSKKRSGGASASSVADDISESVVSGGKSAKEGGGSGGEEQRNIALLHDAQRVARAAATHDVNRSVLVNFLRPNVTTDSTVDPRRFIIEKLLRLCAQQVLTPQATCFLLRLFSECITTPPPVEATNHHLSPNDEANGGTGTGAGVGGGGGDPEEDYHDAEVQVVFGECGALHAATVLLDSTNKRIPAAAMRLGIAALWGGNTRNQNMFLKYFTTNDERFFLSAKRTVEAGVREIRYLSKPRLRSDVATPPAQDDENENDDDDGMFEAEDADISTFGGSSGSLTALAVRRNETVALPCCRPLLRFIQLLCEGHHFLLQEYCRDQRDNIRSVNAVQFCVGFLAAIVDNAVVRNASSSRVSSAASAAATHQQFSSLSLSPATMSETILQCFANLTEFCQGPCSGNQAMLVSSDLIQIVESVLRASESNGVVTASVKRAALTTLISLLEGSTDAHVAETIIRQLSLDNLNRIFHGDVHAEDEDAVGLVFDVGIFLRTVGDLLSETRHRQPFSHHIEAILTSRSDIDQQTGRIQIERDHHLELVYFRIPPSCRRIRYDSKEKLLWEVDRSSQSAKYSSFHDLCEDLILELDLVVELEQIVVAATSALPIVALKESLRKGLNASQRTWITGSVCLAAVTNLLLLMELRFWPIHMTIAAMQIIVCSVALIADWNIAGSVYLHKQRRKDARVALSSLVTSGNTVGGRGSGGGSSLSDDTVHTMSFKAAHAVYRVWKFVSGAKPTPKDPIVAIGSHVPQPDRKNANRQDDEESLSEEELLASAAVSVEQQLLNDEVAAVSLATRELHTRLQHAIIKATRPSFLFTVCMLCCSLGGVVWPEFFAMHLFWCISLSPALQNVVAAVTLNRRTLAVTLFLGMLFCYAFSLVGFALFPDDFDTDDDELTRENCDSLLHCFVFIATSGLRQGGGVGDAMKTIPWGAKNFAARRVFDFLYFAIMIVIFLNILFGIIIDTFAELRDAKHAKERDMRLKCFVCGLGSHVFDQYGDGFAAHTRTEHSMWQYLYFMQHLKLKDPNDYTGQESYVSMKLTKKDFTFFPTRSLNLERRERLIRDRELKHQRSVGGATIPEISSTSAVSRGGGDADDHDDHANTSGGGGDAAAVAAAQTKGLMQLMKSMHLELQSQREELRMVTQRLPTTSTSSPQRSSSRGGGGGGGDEHGGGSGGGVNHLIRKTSNGLRPSIFDSAAGVMARAGRSSLLGGGNVGAITAGGGANNNSGGGGIGGPNMAPLLLTGNEFRVGENVSTQTTFTESVVGLETEVLAARKEGAQNAMQAQRLKNELKAQMDEIRRSQFDRQHANELQQALAATKDQLREQQRSLDAHALERDAALRQNSFLQSEVDRVALENAKLSAQLRTLLTKDRVTRSFHLEGAPYNNSSTATDLDDVRGDEDDANGMDNSRLRNSGLMHTLRTQPLQSHTSLNYEIRDRSGYFASLALPDDDNGGDVDTQQRGRFAL